MSITAKIIAELLPDAQRISQWNSLPDALREQRPIILDTLDFLRDVEPNCAGESLPEDWSATSDSIAARVATVLSAEELVLLKSAPPPADDVQSAAKAGYVDEHFPRAAAALAAIRFVDLREEGVQAAGIAVRRTPC